MAADNNQVDISIKLGADISGGVQSREELDKVRSHAKRMGDDTARSAGSAAKGMQNLEKSVGTVRKVLTGFGVAGLFTALIGGIQKVTESFGSAEEKALELQKAADAKELAKSVSDLAERYETLSTKMANAAKAQNDAKAGEIAKKARELRAKAAAERDAANALQKKRDETARKDKELAEAQALLASGEGTAAGYRDRIAANNRQITETEFGMATGKVSTGVGSAAVSKLQEHNKSLENLLAEILKQIEQSKRVVEKANEQARNSRGVDSTEGA